MHVLVATDWHVIWTRVLHPNNVFFHALWVTVYVSVVSQILGIALGLLAALMRMSRFFVLRLLSGIYVWIFRGTPLLVQIFFIYTAFNAPSFQFGKFWAIPSEATTGILALSINEGAYMREIIRAGIDSIDRGQMEAAKSIGMRYGMAMRRIILPQAARVIVPPLGNEFNNMMKNTSLLYAIGVYELFADADAYYSVGLKSEFFLAVAFWYLMLTTVWTFIQAWIERRLGQSDRGETLTFRERLVLAWDPMASWGRGMPWWGQNR